jgi:hypothetical protein
VIRLSLILNERTGGDSRLRIDEGWGMTQLIRCGVICGFVVTLTAGCGSRKSDSPLTAEQVTPEAQAIINVGQAYRDSYAARKKPPAGINDLKPYLAKFGDPDKVLVSPSDGQPYEITWGIVPGRPPGSAKGSAFLVSEKSGKDGKRYVLDFRFQVRSVTEGELEKLRGGTP